MKKKIWRESEKFLLCMVAQIRESETFRIGFYCQQLGRSSHLRTNQDHIRVGVWA